MYREIEWLFWLLISQSNNISKKKKDTLRDETKQVKTRSQIIILIQIK